MKNAPESILRGVFKATWVLGRILGFRRSPWRAGGSIGVLGGLAECLSAVSGGSDGGRGELFDNRGFAGFLLFQEDNSGGGIHDRSVKLCDSAFFSEN